MNDLPHSRLGAGRHLYLVEIVAVGPVKTIDVYAESEADALRTAEANGYTVIGAYFIH
jgi:hypothetical protein